MHYKYQILEIKSLGTSSANTFQKTILVSNDTILIVGAPCNYRGKSVVITLDTLRNYLDCFHLNKDNVNLLCTHQEVVGIINDDGFEFDVLQLKDNIDLSRQTRKFLNV